MDFPTKQKLHIKSWISRLSIKGTNRQVAQRIQQKLLFFFCLKKRKTKPKKPKQQIPDQFPVALVFSLKLPQKDYLQASGALAGTSDYKCHCNSCCSRCVESSWRYKRFRSLLQVWKVGRTFFFQCRVRW